MTIKHLVVAVMIVVLLKDGIGSKRTDLMRRYPSIQQYLRHGKLVEPSEVAVC